MIFVLIEGISMKISNINVEETIDKARTLLPKEKNISPALRSVFEVLLRPWMRLVFCRNSSDQGSAKNIPLLTFTRWRVNLLRAYLITCRKHGVTATEALEALFKGKLPAFLYQNE